MKVTVGSREIQIDEQDESFFRSRSWFITNRGYLCCQIRSGGRRRTHLFHRLILEPIPEGMVVDHINRDKLDNRRSNLRIVTPQVNAKNIPAKPNKTSKYRGVSWNQKASRWQVVLRIDGRLKWFGLYESEDEAGAVAAPHFYGIAA